ncbi:copper chaperone PCu(A)C [Ramlibacter tataouinensis]|uniref:copper chaperone PCu(A)C n=1 Tax=Ramlibacter tataouinensis TaxID=94132 RepID=UPI0022F3EA83|nr:copper chaperone PCu(A)C [Ramlibacter tataouinensis]WBY00181.1 copper chaperone PCu(A)C [Ramlibacter tataouinensis]
MNATSRTLLGALLALASTAAAWAQATAPVTVMAPWARASVQGQRASGAFMTLVAKEPLTLVGAASPVAGFAEVHEMKMEGEVMRMRPIASLELKPGQPVQLKPGGYHLMLQELKAPLAVNTSIPLTLSFKTAAGEPRELQLQVPVSATPPREAGAADAHGHRKH